jgi:prepilin-type N-terminal cleavage/methylation domain-containing protein
MKKIIKAFTLIELIIVIAIITLISSAWIFYFLDFIKEQEISQKLYIIEDDLEKLDKNVKDYNIFDYELLFNTSNTWSKLYVTYINNFDTKQQKINITTSSWSWVITTYPNTGSWIIKIYKNEKLFLNNEINRINNFSFSFNETPNYKITWTLSWEILNDIHINYFSEDNIMLKKNNNLVLASIYIAENKSWSSYNYLKITNIWWIKKFYNNTTEIISDEIFLFFDNNWKEKFIKIEK